MEIAMTSHTPGPWIVANGLQVWRDGPNAARSPRICTLRNAADPVDQLPADQMAANARLIAAAPDLYEALTELVDLMDGVLEGDYKPDGFTTQPARAALAKSEGRL
jgi:hypothetical protein